MKAISVTFLIMILGLFPHRDLADYVDTMVGVNYKKACNCVVGPMLPYGSINPSPQTPGARSDGYNPDEPIRGFGQLHVSGTGWPTYGNFLVSAQTGLATGREEHDSKHSCEITRPYLFATTLDRYGIRAEVSPAHYSAMYRFTFPASDCSSLVFDAVHSIPGDLFPEARKDVLSSEAHIDARKGVVRLMVEMTGGWPEEPYKLYFVGKFDKALTGAGCWKESEIHEGMEHISAEPHSPEHIGVYCTFPTTEGERVHLKVATSFTGFEKAEELLDSEIGGRDFDRVRDDAKKAWNRKLSCIRVDGGTEDRKTVFYSALFRFFTFAHDRSLDRSSGQSAPFWDDNYAYWDTFRTVYPLLALLDEDCYASNMAALIHRFEERGGIWDAFVAGQDRKRDQGGNDVDCIIADGYMKGVKGVDWKRAYAIVRHNAEEMRLGVDQEGDGGAHLRYKELGWIPACTMSSSQTLEFAYNDWCAAQMASGLGYDDDAEKYLERSKGWTNLWNPELESHGFKGWIDARNADGSFVGVDPAKFGGSWVSPFYEGRSWTYSYFVPHDMPALIGLMGGREEFVKRLDYGYRNRLTEYDNEPGFLTLRAFTEAGRPDLSSIWAHHLMDKKFTLNGYPDNEDTGSMGSWFVFCAMGFFPNAGQPFYYLNAPVFEKVRLKLPGGRTLRIGCNASLENTVIKSCTFRGRILEDARISHEELLRGGRLRMQLCHP